MSRLTSKNEKLGGKYHRGNVGRSPDLNVTWEKIQNNDHATIKKGRDIQIKICKPHRRLP